MNKLKRITAASAALWLSGCAMQYTVDDGRKVDETLLQEIHTYAQGSQALRPAIVRSADLHDKNCSTQWELPFDTASSYALKNKDDKVAWVRGAGIDEHLRVIATSPAVDVKPGDIVTEIDGYDSTNAVKMVKKLVSLRDDGDPFDIKLASGKTVKVTPLKVCRGRTLLAQPGKHADQQDYHWLRTIHPVQIASVPLTPDEAQWVVLWTQGLSEEGGFRMKAYNFGMGVVKLGAVAALAVATAGAGAAAATGAISAGASLGGAVGAAAIAEAPLAVAQVAAAATANSATLHGINWVASSAFDKADKWAFDRMSLLGMDPRAGKKLELQLAQGGATRNAFLLDQDRQKQMDTLVATLPPEVDKQADVSEPDQNGVQVGAPMSDTVSAAPLDATTSTPAPVSAEPASTVPESAAMAPATAQAPATPQESAVSAATKGSVPASEAKQASN